MIDYPAILPPPNQTDYQPQPGQPFVLAGPGNGRASYRRGRVSQPVTVPVSWDFDAGEFMYFEGWFRWTLLDGSRWFMGPAKLGAAISQVEMLFAGDELYSASPLGGQHWRVQATLEIRAWR